jgi:hypothetical protein
MGHYKAMLECICRNNKALPNAVIRIAQISPLMATPLEQWCTASQLMLEKGKGRYIEHMRIIQLVEADLNFVLHIIWGYRLTRQAMCHSAMDPAQYALPSQTCNNVILNKLLFLDLSWQTGSPSIMTDYDATAAFDRILAGLSIITCQHMGLP